MGVREDKKRETRARLEHAALELFAGRGYGRTTVEDVAAMAGVSARLALVEFSERIGTPKNAERARVIEANSALAARSLQLRQVWAEAIAAELATRRGQPAPGRRPDGILGGRDAAAVSTPRNGARRAEVRSYSRTGDCDFSRPCGRGTGG